MLLNFKTTDEINSYFNSWFDLTESERLQFIRELRQHGILSTLSKAPVSEFACPINKFGLVRPCNLISCQYYIESPDNKNCLVSCVNTTKNGRLSINEVSTLMNKSVADINGIITDSIRKIRKALVADKSQSLPIKRYEHLIGHCLNCETSIHDELDLNLKPPLVHEYKKYGWCSESCKKEKPSWQFEIEKEFKCYYKEALAIGLSTYSKPDIVDNIFNLPSGTVSSIKSDLRNIIASW